MQPLFASVWQPKTLILKYFWDILTVSFAAQIGTFPLSTYYFHQFPGLFFITNLLVLPLLGFILALGVFVLVWAFFDIVPTFLAKSLEWSISLLNKIINWVASFESFIFQDISFSWQMLVACYVLVLAFVLWVKQPNFQRLSFALSSLILLQLAYFGNKYFNQSQEELIVFNSKRNTILVERNGENIVVYTNDNLSEANLNFIIRPYLVGNFSHISKTERIQNLAYFNKNRILIVDSLGVFPKGLHPDIVIMTQSPKINLERVLQESRPKMIVADASNYRTDTQRWKATCEKEKIPFHATVEKGFYSLSK
jgi:competence protein ComEC